MILTSTRVTDKRTYRRAIAYSALCTSRVEMFNNIKFCYVSIAVTKITDA